MEHMENTVFWTNLAPELAQHIFNHFVVRRDIFGDYAENGESYTAHRPLCLEKLTWHFNTQYHRVGVHISTLDDKSKVCVWDIDAHQELNESTNFAYALKIGQRLLDLGIKPIIEHSNGNGGYHVWAVFSSLVPTSVIYSFGRWIARDHKAEKIDSIEIFPKQRYLTGKKCGSFVRLPGRHHKRDWWSEFYDLPEGRWYRGEEAPAYLLRPELVANSPDLIPEAARNYCQPNDPRLASPYTGGEAASIWGREWRSKYKGDLTTLRLVDLLVDQNWLVDEETPNRCKIICPWFREHSKASQDEDERYAFLFHDEGKVPGFKCFHGHCVHRHFGHWCEKAGDDLIAKYCDRPYVSVEFEEWAKNGMPSSGGVNAKEPSMSGSAETAEKGESEGVGAKKGAKSKKPSHNVIAHNFVKDCFKRGEIPLFTSGRLFFYNKNRYVRCLELEHKIRRYCMDNSIPQANNLIGNVKPIVENYAWEEAVKVGAMPFWRGDDQPFECAKDVVAFRNGLLDLRKPGKLIDHTPNWCSTFCLPYDFDPLAKCPFWQQFLAQVFEGDRDREALLQEYIGYCLANDTSLQKCLALFGKPRAGKGVTQRVTAAVIGKDNVTSFSLDRLASDFGMSALVGKALAMIGEVELGGNKNKAKIVEVLKSIIGEDEQIVNEKHNPEMPSVRLPTRFLIATNSIPRLHDASGALAHRMLFIPFEMSFVGREDTDLEAKLLEELPGIANWALEGLRRLRANSNRFTLGEAHKRTARAFSTETANVSAFVKECCLVSVSADPGDLPADCLSGDALKVSKRELYSQYVAWCEDKGITPQHLHYFGKELKEMLPKLKDGKISVAGGERENCYQGITVKDWQGLSCVSGLFSCSNTFLEDNKKLYTGGKDRTPDTASSQAPSEAPVSSAQHYTLSQATGGEIPFDLPFTRNGNRLEFRLTQDQYFKLSLEVKSALIPTREGTYLYRRNLS